MTTSSGVVDQIETMVRRLVERFDPDQIILFVPYGGYPYETISLGGTPRGGSHACGTAGPDSDVDLLIVIPVSGSRREKQIEMRVALHDIPVPKDIIVITPEELERRREIVGTVVRPALREGKVLYVRTR
ncbi:MAG: nucleotidyltransferase domain-containing protein [Ardenticatenaceae bacterium]|nr:nucleotidyltransferase domain-containing protein [Ardenticatenaceae bacterium]